MFVDGDDFERKKGLDVLGEGLAVSSVADGDEEDVAGEWVCIAFERPFSERLVIEDCGEEVFLFSCWEDS